MHQMFKFPISFSLSNERRRRKKERKFQTEKRNGEKKGHDDKHEMSNIAMPTKEDIEWRISFPHLINQCVQKCWT